jgi:hypothetical protein
MKEDWLDGETHFFFYSTQYNYVSLVENDSYVIDNDLYVRIRQLSLILYHQFFLCGMVFIGGMGSIQLLSEMKNGIIVIYEMRGEENFLNNIHRANYHFTYSKKPKKN